ncbi:MAG: hypothetical protein ACR2NA_07060 [Solirubrobacterales bacterium]
MVDPRGCFLKTNRVAYPMRDPRERARDYSCERQLGRRILALSGDESHHVRRAHGQEVTGIAAATIKAAPDGEFDLDVDLALIAIGFTGAEPDGAIGQLGLELDARGTIRGEGSHPSNVLDTGGM